MYLLHMLEFRLFVGMCLALLIALTAKSMQPKEKKHHYDAQIQWYENCQFPSKWDMKYVPVCQRSTRRVSKPWCVERTEQLPLIEDLGTQMKLVSMAEDVDGLVAMDFDVPYRILYMASFSSVIVNPEVIETSTTKKTCIGLGPTGEEYLKPNQFTWIKLTYIEPPNLVKREVTFKGRDSCVIQSLLDDLNNLCLVQ